MKRVSILLLVMAVISGCGKDKFETKPQLTVLTDGNVIIPTNSGFRIELEYTDKEGDIDNLIFVKKERINKKATPTIRDSFQLKVPEFPNATKGVIVLNLDYQGHLISAVNPPPGPVPPAKESDSLNFRFVLMDKEGNKSDTAVLSNVIILRN